MCIFWKFWLCLDDHLVTITIDIIHIIQKHYVEDVTTEELIQGAIDGMMISLDPHSAYLTPELYRELQVDTRGTFGGLGIDPAIPAQPGARGRPKRDDPPRCPTHGRRSETTAPKPIPRRLHWQ